MDDFRVLIEKIKISSLSEKLMDCKTRLNEIYFNQEKIFKGDLAVVSCYFNPCNYRARKKNYEIFRKGIVKTGVRFLTVELAFGDGEFELSEFPEVIQLRTSRDNVMWQKERLLNIGIKKLIAEGYEKIAWLDADIVFEDDNWVRKVSKELDKHNVVQVFGEAIREEIKGVFSKRVGILKNFFNKGNVDHSKGSTGFGWAAKSEILNKVELYDCAVVLGENDLLIAYACFYDSNFKEKIMMFDFFKGLNYNFLEHYLFWANEFGRYVNRKVSFASNNVNALFHGDIKNRKYTEMVKLYKKYNYHPKKDVKIGRDGLLEWASDKPKFHKEIRDYFYSRKEDS